CNHLKLQRFKEQCIYTRCYNFSNKEGKLIGRVGCDNLELNKVKAMGRGKELYSCVSLHEQHSLLQSHSDASMLMSDLMVPLFRRHEPAKNRFAHKLPLLLDFHSAIPP
ncbi:hypothetical protein NAB79_19300, partial [Proteus mirabilis]|nr:hypothetical protein [Proteus mirabilis]